MAAAVEVAHAFGPLRSPSTPPATQGIRNAVEAGVDTIEHGYGYDGRPRFKLMKEKARRPMIPTLARQAGGDLHLFPALCAGPVGADARHG